MYSRSRVCLRERERQRDREKERERQRERNTCTLCSASGDAHALVEHQRALPFYFLAMKTSLYFKKKQLFNVTVGLDRRLSLVRSLLVCVRYSPAGMT